MSKHLSEIKFRPLLDTVRLQKISDEQYFSAKYSDYVSNSRLGLINPNQDGSAKKFLDSFAGNRIFSTSLTIGTAVHTQTLQPELFVLPPDLNKPSAKVGFIADEVYNMIKKQNRTSFTKEEVLEACRVVDYYGGNPSDLKYNEVITKITPYIANRFDYEKEHTNATEFLDAKSLETAQGCIDALKINKKVQNLLHPTGICEDPISENEQAILMDVEVILPDIGTFIVRLKAKLDNFTIDKETNTITINDVKTIGRTLNYCDEQILKYHYHREMAVYAYLLSNAVKVFYDMECPSVKSNFLWVSTIPGYYTKVTSMTRQLFQDGFNEFRDLLKLASIALYYKDPEQYNTYIVDEL